MLLLCVLILTGCSKTEIDINNYSAIFDTFLSMNTTLVNNYSTGYKYYLPTGVRVIKSNDYNDVLSYDGYNYYCCIYRRLC